LNTYQTINQIIKLIDDIVIYFERHIDLINDLNVFPVPDGDTGRNMYATIKGISERLDKNYDSLEKIYQDISTAALYEGRGNSGVILSQIIRGIISSLKLENVINNESFTNAMNAGADAAYRSVVNPVEGTMLTVIKDIAVESRVKINQYNLSTLELISYLTGVAKLSVDFTPNQMSLLKETGVVDSGGYGLEIIINAIEISLKGKNPKSFPLITRVTTTPIIQQNESSNKSIHIDEQYGYCTQFILISDLTEKILKEKLDPVTTSLVIIDGDGIYRIHLHTLSTNVVTEIIESLGKIEDLTIEDMDKQSMTDYSTLRQDLEPNDCALMVMANGEGNCKIFADFGAHSILITKANMNPSVSEILECLNQVKCSSVIVLPNNKNIFAAVKEASKITELNVITIPTQTIQEGIECAAEYNHKVNIKSNQHVMLQTLNHIESLAIFKSARQFKFNSKTFQKETPIVMKDDKIINAKTEILELLLESIQKELVNDCEHISVLVGLNYNIDEINKFLLVNLNTSNIEKVEVHYGGQYHFDFLLSIIQPS